MGSIGAQNNIQPAKTRTERLVSLIADDIIGGWIEDSYMDEDELSTIEDWHDLLEHLNMEAAEAREDIIEDLWDRAGTWDFNYARKHSIPEEDQKLVFLDGEFENENGDYIKYGEIMKQVKAELKKKGILQHAK